MRLIPVIALAASLSATAAIAPLGSSRSAPIAVPFDSAATGMSGGGASGWAATEVTARKRKLARRDLDNRRRVLGGGGRFMAAGRRPEASFRRSEGPSPNLPPNLGVGIGTFP
jgi:hypothetical protein